MITRSVYDKVSQICTKIFGASRTSDRQVVFTVIYRLNNWRLRLQMTQINGGIFLRIHVSRRQPIEELNGGEVVPLCG